MTNIYDIYDITSYLNTLKTTTNNFSQTMQTSTLLQNESLAQVTSPLADAATGFLNMITGIPGAISSSFSSFWNNPWRAMPIVGTVLGFIEDHPWFTGFSLGLGILYVIKKLGDNFGFSSGNTNQIIINNYVNTPTPESKPEIKTQPQPETKVALITGPTIEDLDTTSVTPLTIEDVKPNPTFTPQANTLEKVAEKNKKYTHRTIEKQTMCEEHSMSEDESDPKTHTENKRTRRCITQTLITEASVEVEGKGEISPKDVKETKKRSRAVSRSRSPMRRSLEYKEGS